MKLKINLLLTSCSLALTFAAPLAETNSLRASQLIPMSHPAPIESRDQTNSARATAPLEDSHRLKARFEDDKRKRDLVYTMSDLDGSEEGHRWTKERREPDGPDVIWGKSVKTGGRK
ncbi:hypothetical protein QBC34DRAFT_428570 [Podospora aff. communis PSN243]|uniref:Uncharacterized protein n=1 Tax=Podospora aff. communis PSN243 TaxID=3040156 RepID=A0AAV9GCZ7_9PEZI|nr:hypothetical protein QBC34DRAFT_428570 [Podospora aff. communis PSN243]